MSGPNKGIGQKNMNLLNLELVSFETRDIVTSYDENQKVIDTGLYGIVRHPMYTSTIFLSRRNRIFGNSESLDHRYDHGLDQIQHQES